MLLTGRMPVTIARFLSKRRREKNFSTNFYHVRYISFMWFQHFNKILVRQK